MARRGWFGMLYNSGSDLQVSDWSAKDERTSRFHELSKKKIRFLPS